MVASSSSMELATIVAFGKCTPGLDQQEGEQTMTELPLSGELSL